MATEQHLNPDSPRPVVSTSQPFRPEEFPRVSHAAAPRSSGGLGAVVLNALVALLAGGGGAWGYLNYIHPELARQQAQENQPAAPDPARLDDLGRRLDELQARVDKLPKPSQIPDLEPINQKLSEVDDLSRKLEAQRVWSGQLPEKIDENARKITALMADLNGVRGELSTLRTDVLSAKTVAPPASPAEKPTASPSAAAIAALARPGEDAYARGIRQYRERQFKAASETFQKLTATQADDARVWYYAALARGFDTGNWKGETERLVTQGVDLEKAGKPEKPTIDAAFAELTTETGKDWLAFYRRRAAAR